MSSSQRNVNWNSTEETDESTLDDVSLTPSSASTTDDSGYLPSKRLCCNFAPSPYPMYIANAFYFASYAINAVVLDSMLFNKICFQKYQNRTLCAGPKFSYNHPELQEDVATWGNYNSLAELPLAIITTLMLSSYCDKVGHKLPYVLPIIGNALCTIYLAILATPRFVDWPMASIFGYSFLHSVMGSFPMVLMSSFSYVGLVVPREKRTTSMAICEGTLLVGSLIGTVINGPIIDSIGLANMSYINAVITLLPLPVVLIFLTDITVASEIKHSWRDMIGMSHLLDAVKCVFKKREGKTRLMLNLSFIAFTFAFFVVSGLSSLSFLYFVKEREMTLTLYSAFSGYTSGVKGFAGPILVFIVKKIINPNQLNVGIAAAVSMIFGYIIIAIDSIPGGIWIGTTFLGTQTVFFAINRSLQIGFVEKDELGKIFAYDAVIETIMGAASSIFFKALYSATLPAWSGMFLEMCALLYFIALIVFLYLCKLKTAEDKRKSLLNDNLL